MESGRAVTLPATDREHLGTVLFGLWMTVGLFLDGYFHQNLDGDSESFLTPWHGVFYAGFAASLWWLVTLSRRRSPGQTDWRLGRLPPGYGGARTGIALFAVGGVGDALWHAAFGVERGVDALLSPTHLVLFVGLLLILTAPLRAVREASVSPPSPWIVVGSVVSATALVGFFLNFAWGLGLAALARVAYDPISEIGETQVIAGVASMLVTTVVLFGAARILIDARSARPGALTVLFGVVALLVSVAFDEDAEGVVAAVIAGATLDILLARLPASRRVHADVAWPFAVASAALWSAYLGLLEALDGTEWQAEIWVGAVVLNVLAAYAVASITTVRRLGEPSMRQDSTRESVRQRYAELASTAAQGGTCCTPDEQMVFGASRYESTDLDGVPATAASASIGCGNPTSVAELRAGEVVLDLGSGGGIDVILSARRVGPTGKAYGLDMTDEMLDLARANAAEASVANVEFLHGHIEAIPLPDASVDVVISNCVINLSTDKAAVLREAARVLRPDGRFAVSDIVADADIDDATRHDIDQWTGCVAGALTAADYVSLLTTVGFADVEIIDSHRVHAHATSAIIRARKPS